MAIRIYNNHPRSACAEILEARQLLAADGLAVSCEPSVVGLAQTSSNDRWTPESLSPANLSTQIAGLHDLGFDGEGQTVVIIDSGIAYDHEALGNGFGVNSRVVGGWDFAENDADPYDDGPTGFHGTHVAGIVGSSDADHKGLAPNPNHFIPAAANFH